ncbi:unnamed protein product [Clavelina lepadiformis]|uniref:Uncharacterized protein n=1 Tax=Clavelina lepadiformis TaxID=159417 RepID=A0ABP0GHS5_CLALP
MTSIESSSVRFDDFLYLPLCVSPSLLAGRSEPRKILKEKETDLFYNVCVLTVVFLKMVSLSIASLVAMLDANDQPLPGQEPFNQVDAIVMKHDICYRDIGKANGNFNDSKKGELKCDKETLMDQGDPNLIRRFCENMQGVFLRVLSLLGWRC